MSTQVRSIRDIGLRAKAISLRFGNSALPILTIVLIVIAAILLNLLIKQTFEPYFKCTGLLTGPFGSLCDQGLRAKWDYSWVHIDLQLLQAFDRLLNGPLEVVRKVVAWTIVILFAVVSLILASIASKIIRFVVLLMTPEGRRVVLTDLSLWLFFFVVFSAVFYFWVVR